MILNISSERSFNTLLEYVEKQKTIFYDIIGQNALSIAQRRIPHSTGFGPDEWLYSAVVVLVGNSPRDCGPGGQ